MSETAHPMGRHLAHEPGRHPGTRTLATVQVAVGLMSAWYFVLLEDIGDVFAVSVADLNWVSAIFMLGAVVTVPICSKLGDIHGHRRMLVTCLAVAMIGTTVVAIAPSFLVLLVGRGMQAPLAAVLPLMLAIVKEQKGEDSGRSVGVLIAASIVGGATGGIGGGILLELMGLRAILWIPVLLLAACAVGVARRVPETTIRAAGVVDWWGGALLSVGLLLLLLGISNGDAWGWLSAPVLGSMGVGLALLTVWVYVERRVAHPLIDLAVMGRGGLGVPMVVAALSGAQFFGSTTATVVYALSDGDVGLGVSPVGAGLIVMTTTVGTLTLAVLGDRIARATSVRFTLSVGGLLTAGSFLIVLSNPESVTAFYAAALVTGAGNGISMSVLPALVVRLAPSGSAGIVSGLYNTSRTAAGAAAGAVFAAVMSVSGSTAGTEGNDGTDYSAYSMVWTICLFVGVVIAALAWTIREPAMATSEPGGGPEGGHSDGAT